MIVGPHQSDSAAGAVATASTVSNDERAMLAPQASIYTLFMCSASQTLQHQPQLQLRGHEARLSSVTMGHNWRTGCGLQVRVAQKNDSVSQLGGTWRERARSLIVLQLVFIICEIWARSDKKPLKSPFNVCSQSCLLLWIEL